MRLFPLSESTLTIELGNDISPALNDRAIAIADHFEDHPFPGLLEAVPAYASVTIFYDPASVKRAYPGPETAFETVNEIAKRGTESVAGTKKTETPLVEIPMTVSSDASPDLAAISKHSGLGADEVVDIFLSRTYRVFMLGFLPGFGYMGQVDERIAAPRHSTPRIRVPHGSIGIASKQTGIYPLDSPGGWNIIGRTDLKMFNLERSDPCLLRPGDEVRFIRR